MEERGAEEKQCLPRTASHRTPTVADPRCSRPALSGRGGEYATLPTAIPQLRDRGYITMIRRSGQTGRTIASLSLETSAL